MDDITLRMKFSVSSSTKYIVHQSVPKSNQIHQYELIESSNFDLPLSQILQPCLSGVSISIQLFDINQTNNENSITTVDDYFR